ncbi:parvin, alpha b isoform X1 [Silurus meridionalis]|uniref:parvin, alpha b isoform X1 n=1 Tax=Silurus meridionalis TaxID=175797 RepID=UPI001EEB6BEB|nr:parvin, alpha b isoform X1 [Silurus meridionalis]
MWCCSVFSSVQNSTKWRSGIPTMFVFSLSGFSSRLSHTHTHTHTHRHKRREGLGAERAGSRHRYSPTSSAEIFPKQTLFLPKGTQRSAAWILVCDSIKMASSPQKSPSSPKSPSPRSPPSRKKDDSFLGKLGGTLARRKKAKEVSELQEEGMNAINLPLSPTPFELDPEDTMLEENEVRTMVDPNSRHDPKLQELTKFQVPAQSDSHKSSFELRFPKTGRFLDMALHLFVLIDWINDVLVGERIIVKDLAEDLYDGQVLQKLFEKLEGEKLNVAEVTQSEIAQKQKLQTVLEKINDTLKVSSRNIKWNIDSIHAKSIVAILHLLVALSQHFRAPIRLPDHVSIQVVVVQKREGILQSQQVLEEITGNTEALSGRHERDAFDTLFDHAPDKLNVVKKTLLTFVNKHLNKLNLEVSELDTQFADGVYLVLLMGLLEGYFVPLYNFFLTPDNFDHKVHNVSFSFELMQDGGLEKPKPRPEDIVNCDLKSTLRVLYNLFTKYRNVE